PFYGDPAANSKDNGAVYVVWGSEALTSGATIDLAAASNDEGAPASLLAVGGPGESLGDTVRLADFNFDGRADVVAGPPAADGATGYVAVFGGRPRADADGSGTFAAAPDAVVRGPHAGWRAGDDAVALDATFAGRPLLVLGAPRASYIPFVGLDAGEMDG